MCQQATAEFPQFEKLLTRQLVVVIAAIVIATPVSAASGAAGDTCVRHRRQWPANSSLRGTDAEHIPSSAAPNSTIRPASIVNPNTLRMGYSFSTSKPFSTSRGRPKLDGQFASHEQNFI
jgi:hypothetical protein